MVQKLVTLVLFLAIALGGGYLGFYLTDYIYLWVLAPNSETFILSSIDNLWGLLEALIHLEGIVTILVPLLLVQYLNLPNWAEKLFLFAAPFLLGFFIGASTLYAYAIHSGYDYDPEYLKSMIGLFIAALIATGFIIQHCWEEMRSPTA